MSAPFTRKWTSQPGPRSAEPRGDWNAVFDFGRGRHDLTGRIGHMAPLPAAAVDVRAGGLGLRFATTDVSTTTGRIVPGISSGITAVMVAEPLATTAANNFLFAEARVGGPEYNWGFYETSGGSLRAFVHNGTTGASHDSGYAWSSTRNVDVLVMTYGDGDNFIRIYRNGNELLSGTAQTGNIQRHASAGLGMQCWNVGGASLILYAAAVAPHCMPAAKIRLKLGTLTSTWNALFRPRRAWVPVGAVGGGTTVAIGQVTESDTAQALTVLASKTVAVGQVAETDTAQALTALASKTVAVGQVAETDTAQALTVLASKVAEVGQVTETDTAQALTVVTAGSQTVAIGQVVEADSAQALTVVASKVGVIGQVTEADTAQALTPVLVTRIGIALVLEIDVAQALTSVGPQTIGIGQVSELDVAQALTAPGYGGVTPPDYGSSPNNRLAARVVRGLLIERTARGAVRGSVS